MREEEEEEDTNRVCRQYVPVNAARTARREQEGSETSCEWNGGAELLHYVASVQHFW